MAESTTLSASDILGAEGSIAKRLASYEDRPEQLEMAEAVASAIAAKRHLIVEAGTGVGKSFAYLVPAILAATEPIPADAKGDDAKRPRRAGTPGPSVRTPRRSVRTDRTAAAQATVGREVGGSPDRAQRDVLGAQRRGPVA